MFAFKYLLSLSAILAVQAVATPTTRNFPCLSDAEAKNQANHFAELVRSYSNSSADAYLTPDFVDYSDSVIQLMNGGCPNNPRQLGTATFTSRQAFKDAEGNQPAIPFEILKVWHDCDTSIFRWVSKMSPGIVTGITILETVYKDGKWKIKTVYAEFNSGSWAYNLGQVKPTRDCSA